VDVGGTAGLRRELITVPARFTHRGGTTWLREPTAGHRATPPTTTAPPRLIQAPQTARPTETPPWARGSPAHPARQPGSCRALHPQTTPCKDHVFASGGPPITTRESGPEQTCPGRNSRCGSCPNKPTSSPARPASWSTTATATPGNARVYRSAATAHHNRGLAPLLSGLGHVRELSTAGRRRPGHRSARRRRQWCRWRWCAGRRVPSAG